MDKTKNLSKRLQNFKNNVKKHNPNIKTCVKALIPPFQEIRICHQN